MRGSVLVCFLALVAACDSSGPGLDAGIDGAFATDTLMLDSRPFDSRIDTASDAGTDAGETDPAPTCTEAPDDDALREQIMETWESAKPSLLANVETEALQARPYNLYNVQLWTANLLIYAELQQDTELLSELVELYRTAFAALEVHDSAVFYYARAPDGSYPRRQVFPLETPARMWTTRPQAGNAVGEESVLVSSQFSYALARVVRVIAGMKSPSPELLSFVAEAVPIVVNDHYLRWIHRPTPDSPAFFQTRGWGCTVGTFDHAERTDHLLHRRFGTAELGRVSDLSYCNAVLDTDLWIFAGAAEILAAVDLAPSRISVSAADRDALAAHVRAGVEVIESRHELVAIPGMEEMGAIFGRGEFDDHADFRYSGFTESGPECLGCASSCPDTCPEFPGSKGEAGTPPRVSPVPTRGNAWDISHARRLPHAYDSLRRHRAVIGTGFPDTEAVHQLARQLAFVVYEEDRGFSNFFDGGNGWYRVNYSNRVAHGNAPGYFSSLAATMSYGFWTPLEPALESAFESVRQLDNDSWQYRILMLPESTTASLFESYCVSW